MNKYKKLESNNPEVQIYLNKNIELDKYKNKKYYIGDIGGIVSYKITVTNLTTGEEEEIEDECDIDATYPNSLCCYDVEEFKKGIADLERSVLFDAEYTENPKEEYVRADEIKIYIDKIEVRQEDL